MLLNILTLGPRKNEAMQRSQKTSIKSSFMSYFF